ncbi:unnamed protein product [Diatraea saccharalis]|uniref:Anticodon-binding domain-containing protein n=1 Tax=Diatraea saccharalis TaxID=40085 RepID=A0A9N9WBB1_9NEOP|nr:unnamed protein product [Diatraea saccharalis]
MMKNKFKTVFSMAKFFRIINSTDHSIAYNLKESSILLLNNIYYSWLKTIYLKIPKNMTIFTSKKNFGYKYPGLPYGIIESNFKRYNENTLIEQPLDLIPKLDGRLILRILVPQHDSLQYFIQWQRYRKYWWSSVTTTPSLFAINEVKYENDTADAYITAQFPWGQHTVETITMTKENVMISYYKNLLLFQVFVILFFFFQYHNTSCITCSTSLENALFIILHDGLCNSTNEEYVRLHRSMAPYKISFVLDFKDQTYQTKLYELARLIDHKLKKSNISTYLPYSTLTAGQQMKENLHLGVAYMAVLNENTLNDGIIQLLNSNTMLKEQVHLADFNAYAKLLCI